jgi:prepilin-type N-terminal cleavage/methylation domain-containing protein
MIIRGNISRGGVEIQKAALPRRVRGFSLIEMLMVIAVIGILAAIVLGALPAMTEKRVRTRVRGELRNLVTAIEAYKEKHGFYPPDNPKNIAHPPLFYELIGTTVVGNNPPVSYKPVNGDPALTQTQVKDNFDTDGFLNSAPEASEVKNFLTTAKTNINYVISPFSPNGSPALVLRVSADGPRFPGKPGIEKTNAWRYVVAKPRRGQNDPYPTNNPNTFDLWAEVVIRGRTNLIGNWKEE